MPGYLRHPFILELAQIDYADIATGEGGGFDRAFREQAGSEDDTLEKTHLMIPCQTEFDSYGSQSQQAGGENETSNVVFVFHFDDLAELGLIDPNTGQATINVNDRAVALYTIDGLFIQDLGRDSTGLYCTQAQPSSFGLYSQERNLLVCTFSEESTAYKNG